MAAPVKRKKSKKQQKEPEVLYNTLDEAYLRHAFDEFDKDKSGKLERDEAIAALTTIGSKLSFEDLDRDKDGGVSFEEFMVFSTLIGRHSFPIWKKASRNTVGGDISKPISVFAGQAHTNAAFMQTASKSFRKLGSQAKANGYTLESLQKLFNRLDDDASGELDVGEIRKAIKTLAPQTDEMDITVMLKCCDKDDDGKISFEEFQTMMLYDHESDVPYWEKYGDRDMHIGLKDRRHQDRQRGVVQKP